MQSEKKEKKPKPVSDFTFESSDTEYGKESDLVAPLQDRMLEL